MISPIVFVRKTCHVGLSWIIWSFKFDLIGVIHFKCQGQEKMMIPSRSKEKCDGAKRTSGRTMKDSVKSSIKGFDGFESISQQEQVSNPRPSSVHFGTTGLAFALLDNLNSGPNRSNSAPSMRPAHRGLPPVVISTLHLHHLVKHGQWWGKKANRKLLDPLCPCLLDPL